MNFRTLFFGNYSNKQILAKNTFWLGLNEVISKVIMFVVTISLVRYLGPTGFGAYNFALSYVAILVIFSDLGLGTILTRDVAKNKLEAEKYLGNTLGIKFFGSIIVLILTLFSFPFLGNNRQFILLILLTTLYSLSQQIQMAVISIITAFEKMEYIFVIKIIYYLGILLVALVTTRLGLKIEILMSGYFSISLLSILMAVIFLNKLGINLTIGKDLIFWKKLLKETMPIFGLMAASTVYANFDSLLIAQFFGNKELGIYQSAYKILFAFYSINIINMAIFPRMSILTHEKKDMLLSRMIKIVTGISLLILIPLASLISWKSNLIINLIYGKEYFLAGPILVVLIWSGVVNYFRILITNLLIARRSQIKVFYAVTVGLMVNIVLNILITTKMGFGFAATNILISEIVILLISIWFAKK